jgi:hypothetical protein
VHRIRPGPVLQSPTQGRFQTTRRLSEPRPPPALLFSDRRTPPVGSDRAEGFPHPHAPPLRSPITSVSLTPKGSPSHSPLWPSPEATFTAATSAQAHYRSLTSEPAPSATPSACRRWCPSARAHCCGWSIPSELLHLPLLSSIHRGHNTLFLPSPFFLAQEYRKELGAATVPLLWPP